MECHDTCEKECECPCKAGPNTKPCHNTDADIHRLVIESIIRMKAI